MEPEMRRDRDDNTYRVSTLRVADIVREKMCEIVDASCESIDDLHRVGRCGRSTW
jgi:hypothetical protein